MSDRSLPEADPSSLPSPPTGVSEVRWLFYTSGTTADPKGAQHTDETIHAVAKGMAERLAVSADDRNALAFATGKFGGAMVDSLGQTNFRQQHFRPFTRFTGCGGVGDDRDQDVFNCGQLRQ